MPRGEACGDYSAQVLSSTVVLFTEVDTVSRTQSGKTISSTGQFTFVVAKTEAG
jgi:hypothetical protein